MTAQTAGRRSALASRAIVWIGLGVAAALLFFLVSGGLSYSNVQTLRADNEKIVHSHDVIVALDGLLSTMQDAETGQRGFVLTGNEKYLEPYSTALANAPQSGAGQFKVPKVIER